MQQDSDNKENMTINVVVVASSWLIVNFPSICFSQNHWFVPVAVLLNTQQLLPMLPLHHNR